MLDRQSKKEDDDMTDRFDYDEKLNFRKKIYILMAELGRRRD
jgi:hypothetical protein